MLSTTTIERVIIERTILGMCLVERSGYPKISDILSPKNFSDADGNKGIYISHRQIYSAFEKLYPIKPINLVSVVSILGAESIDYVYSISANVFSASEIRYHAFQLLEFSIRESFIALLTKLSEGKADITAVAIHEIIDEALDYDNDLFQIIDTAVAYLSKIDSPALSQVVDFRNKINVKITAIKRLASIDVLLQNLTNINRLGNDAPAQMAITHLTDLIKSILTRGKISNTELTKILNTSL